MSSTRFREHPMMGSDGGLLCARATDDVHLEDDVLHFVYARDAEDARRQLYT